MSMCRLMAAVQAKPRPATHLTRVALAAAAALVASTVALVGAPLASAATAGEGRPRLGPCGAGALCLWESPRFTGERLTFELAGFDLESCVVLPPGFTADAYANRTGRPVTVYQSPECATTGEFQTHPSGSWTPEATYQVRAFKVWEH